MRYLTFTPQEHSSYETCFLVPKLDRPEMVRHYIEPHLKGREQSLLAYDLYREGKKTKVSLIREYLGDLLPTLTDLQVKYLVVADADYFKVLTKAAKVDNVGGYVMDVAEEFGSFKAVYCPNFRSVFYDPEKTSAKIEQALSALKRHIDGDYEKPGTDILRTAVYPQGYEQIRYWLQRLLDMDCDLAIDIEAFSLKHHTAGIGTIAFAWNKHEGVAFAVDYEPIPGATQAPFGRQVRNGPVRQLLKEFFKVYLRRALWHNASFDLYVLIYQLFMNDLLDKAGMLNGMGYMLRNFDDTKLITYLATNSCAGNVLGLKPQSQEFSGNYAVEDIEDITKIPLDRLLTYNLIDSCATWFVFEKHWDRMVADQQLPVYEEIFKPGLTDIIEMQLTGMPLYMPRVKEVQLVLQAISDHAREAMNANPHVQEFCHEETDRSWKKDYEDRKGKAKNPDKILPKDRTKFPHHILNPNSPKQLQRLLYEQLELPVIDLTDTKLPATGGDTLEKLINHATSKTEKDFLTSLIEFKAVDKILTAFIPAFLEAPQDQNGWHWLFGFFNLGGTVSGRLSSSEPNLQNLPANVTMKLPAELVERFKAILGPYVKNGKLSLGKLIKSCFRAPPGWLFIGLDFASLEDRISALTTKDPNKLKVYQGHIVYEVMINGTCHHIRDDSTVVYDGVTYTGEQFYAAMSNR